MGLFSLTKEIAIDLGTANTVIIHNDKIVIDEPSIVALDRRSDKLIAVGKEAQLMEGREHPGIRTVRPLRKGVIADFNAAERCATRRNMPAAAMSTCSMSLWLPLSASVLMLKRPKAT